MTKTCTHCICIEEEEKTKKRIQFNRNRLKQRPARKQCMKFHQPIDSSIFNNDSSDIINCLYIHISIEELKQAIQLWLNQLINHFWINY